MPAETVCTNCGNNIIPCTYGGGTFPVIHTTTIVPIPCEGWVHQPINKEGNTHFCNGVAMDGVAFKGTTWALKEVEKGNLASNNGVSSSIEIVLEGAE